MSKGNRDEQKELKVQTNLGYFGIDKPGLVILFDKYQRMEAFDEDIDEVINLGGTEGILSKVRTTFDKGISDTDKLDIQERIKAFGENKFHVEPMPHCCEYVWEGLQDLMIRILILAALFQIIVGAIPQLQESPNDWIEGLSIVFAVVIVVSVGSVTNYSKEKKFRELNEKNNALVQITIRRDGQVKTVQEEAILVGDIIKVELGMILPADGYLIEGNDIKVEEASLTGESDLIEKDPLDHIQKRIEEEVEANKGNKPKGKHVVGSPLVFSGTLVTEGSGWMVALRIGPDSEKGKIQAQVEAEQQKGKEKGGKKDSKKDANEGGKDAENSEKEKEGEEEEEEDDEDEGKTPLELKLDILANDVGMFGIMAAVFTFVALVIRLIYFAIKRRQDAEITEIYRHSNWYNNTLYETTAGRKVREYPSALSVIVELIKAIILCIAIIVVAIPEGLPLAVTLSLAFSIQKMMEDNNLVRKMNACETMGGANYICSDKTGTLTKNEMSVDQFYDCSDQLDFQKLTSDKKSRADPTTFFLAEYFEIFRLATTLNIDVEIDNKEEIVKGSKTDYAFVHLLHNLKEEIFKTREAYFKGEEIKRFPFTSSRKKMSTIVSHDNFPTKHRMFLKGASEIVLQSCQYYVDSNKIDKCVENKIIDDTKKVVLQNYIKKFADLALRTICVAYKDVSQEQVHNWKDKDETGGNLIEKDDFVLVGLFGIKDQLRDGVADAVDKCKNAGITVVMVTGDNLDTANAIARDCHILTPEIEKEAKENGKILSWVGKDFYNAIGGMRCDTCDQDLKFCSCPRTEGQAEAIKKKKQELDPNWDEEIKLRTERIVNMKKYEEICRDIRVIARSRPEDKYTMVYGLKELGEVVAVTGDGTNDAPALSKSDVGFAMGVSGTDIAKQAADIIILDDNFATIVQAVKWGRNIYDNIRKFIQFQLTVNICACLLVFISCCIGKETPLSPIQMLWVNLIMDSLGSLALATEPPNENLLTRKPYPKTEYIINSLMWKHTFYQAMVELMLMLLFYLYGHWIFPETNKDIQNIARLLKNCYGYIPGQEHLSRPEQNELMMIAGPTIFWPSTVEKLPEALPGDCGIFWQYENLDLAHHSFSGIYGSTHLTVIFNTFVIYTLLNQINARVIDDSYNIFAGIQKNYLFLVIIFVELGLQVIIVQLGNVVFKVSIYGIDGPQWGICFAFGFITYLVNVLLKPIPLQKCFEAIYNLMQKMKADKEEKENAGNKDEDKEGKAKTAPNKEEVELQSRAPNKLHSEEIRINSKENSQKNLAKSGSGADRQDSHHDHNQSMEDPNRRKPNSTLLNLRRPSISRQATHRQQSKMRSIKEGGN